MRGAEKEKLRELENAYKKVRVFKADHFIFALDLPAAKRIVFDNPGFKSPGDDRRNDYFDRITRLTHKSHYVACLWYDDQEFWRKVFQDKANFFGTGFEQLGVTLNWSYPIRMNIDGKPVMRPWISDYANHKVSVIETHIARTEKIASLTSEEIARLCHAEFKAIMPDIPDFKAHYVNRWDNFTGFRPGDEANRPAIQSPLKNLLFIGDWVSTDHACVFMEKTNVTAKLAVNILLDTVGQKAGRIRILESYTPSILIDALRGVASIEA